MSLINTAHHPISHPNVFTAVGALCVDAQLRRNFFHPEMRPLQDQLPNIEDTEFRKCLSLCPSDPAMRQEPLYAEVGVSICKRPPCIAATPNCETVLGATILDEHFREEWFNHPEKAHQEYGFELTDEENILLCAIVQRRGRDLRKAVDALGKELKGVISFEPLAKVPKFAKAAAADQAA
jgi:hypothetical protein